MNQQSKNERDIWALFMNAPGPEAITLYEQAQKILIARNILKPPRVRKSKKEGVTDGSARS